MRVLHLRGGDGDESTLAAARWTEALRRAGVEVDEADGADELSGYDLVHRFGDAAAGDPHLEEVREAGVPLVVSPLRIDGAAATLGAVPNASIVVAASEVEAYLLGDPARKLGLAVVVAPFGVDDEAFAIPRGRSRAGILCLAPIEPQHNQLTLIEAARDLDADLTIAGAAPDAAYLAQLRAAATPRTRIHADPDPATTALVGRCAVYAHPSRGANPGIGALDAAAAGARLVVGDRGSEREAFGADAEYVDPDDVAGIAAALARALARRPRERGDALERRLGARTWQRCAEATLEAYARALAPRR